MNNIPKKLNDNLNEDPFYRYCCLYFLGGCSGRIQRHHNLIYASNQVQRKFCILPACEGHHDQARKTEIKELFDWIMLNRAKTEELLEFSKSTNYVNLRDKLNKKYGKW